jgi:hypothetical protein
LWNPPFFEGFDMTVARLLFMWTACFALVAAAPRPGAAQSAGSTTAIDPATGEITPTQSPWGWIKMPKISMPKIEMPKMPADPLAPVKTSAHKVGEGAKKAWEGTKELFTFGGKPAADEPTARVASRTTTGATSQEQPSMWQRMFGAKEKPREPQSVAEWMNQPRLDP